MVLMDRAESVGHIQILGYVLNRLCLLIENRVLAWHYGYTQQRS